MQTYNINASEIPWKHSAGKTFSYGIYFKFKAAEEISLFSVSCFKDKPNAYLIIAFAVLRTKKWFIVSKL